MKCTGVEGQEWSLHAKMVVRHGAGHVAEDGAVHMEYSWSPAPRPTGPTPLYAFRRGDLLFTAAPPACGINRLKEQAPHTLPRAARPAAASQLSCSPVCVAEVPPQERRTPQPYERRCRSSCSITLSCDEKPVSRTQSLRTQESQGRKTTRAHTFTTQFSTHVLNERRNIKDVASQTHNSLSPDVSTASVRQEAQDSSKTPNQLKVSGPANGFKKVIFFIENRCVVISSHYRKVSKIG